jgi:hypothetical protein
VPCVGLKVCTFMCMHSKTETHSLRGLKTPGTPHRIECCHTSAAWQPVNACDLASDASLLDKINISFVRGCSC